MHTNTDLHIKFWGVRGSYPVPGAGTLGIGGNTPSVEITAGGQTLILDAGSGIIGLGRALMARTRETGRPVEATILFSHLHHDHVQGFPFFVPSYVGGTRLSLIGPAFAEKTADVVLAQNQMPPLFPVTLNETPSLKQFSHVQGGMTLLMRQNFGEMPRWDAIASAAYAPSCGLVISTHRSYAHPGGGVLCYRIEYGGHSIVYATDTEGYVGGDQRLIAFAKDADILIHDAQFAEEHYLGQRAGLGSTQGHGHSTASMAAEVAAAAGVQRLILFHHDPGYDDETIQHIEAHAQSLFPHATAAYEGLEITLGDDPINPVESISLPMSVTA